MGALLFFLFSWWGIILQVIAIVHYIRRRPDGYWLWIIIFFGGIGALIYIVAEVIPDAGLLRQSFKVFPRRKRIHELESAILDNPSAGNYEELADLYLEEGQYARAHQCYDKAISSRTDLPDAFYRRGITEIEMGDFAAAIPDLERVVAEDPKYDFQRAAGLLAHAYANASQPAKAEALFQEVTNFSTSSETYYNYACFLASHQRVAEAREWAKRILDKKPTMPAYQRRRERTWFRRANALLLRLRA
ncbi:MAG TPA: tetratricopeptide repeat protein [Terriglobales bacterium]|nr:tetratricopeptide repeat protein [Terriglobales bacterium]